MAIKIYKWEYFDKLICTIATISFFILLVKTSVPYIYKYYKIWENGDSLEINNTTKILPSDWYIYKNYEYSYGLEYPLETSKSLFVILLKKKDFYPDPIKERLESCDKIIKNSIGDSWNVIQCIPHIENKSKPMLALLTPHDELVAVSTTYDALHKEEYLDLFKVLKE